MWKSSYLELKTRPTDAAFYGNINKLLCERTKVDGQLDEVIKGDGSVRIKDRGAVFFMSCGFTEDIAGAGVTFRNYLYDQDKGEMIKKIEMSGHQISMPSFPDVNVDGTDEILWSSSSCTNGVGCFQTYHLYSIVLDQEFSLTIAQNTDGAVSDQSEKKYSTNLEQAEFKVHRDYLTDSAPKVWGILPVRESRRYAMPG